MKKSLRVGAAAAVLVVLVVAAWAGEKKVKLDDVPAAVKTTMLKEAGDHKIEKVAVKTKKDKTIVYLAEWEVAKEVDHEITVAADGKLLKAQDEREIKLDEAPAAVKATILKEADANKVDEVNEVTQDKKVTYEAEFKANGKEVEVKVAADGTLLKREVEEEDDKD